METKLKKIRIESKMSQKELASVAQVSVRTLCRYENGQQIPPLDTAFRIASYYKMLIEDVFNTADYLADLPTNALKDDVM